MENGLSSMFCKVGSAPFEARLLTVLGPVCLMVALPNWYLNLLAFLLLTSLSTG